MTTPRPAKIDPDTELDPADQAATDTSEVDPDQLGDLPDTDPDIDLSFLDDTDPDADPS